MKKHRPSPMTEEQLRATQERRRSNAAGLHLDARMRRIRTRSAAKRSALKDW